MKQLRPFHAGFFPRGKLPALASCLAAALAAPCLAKPKPDPPIPLDDRGASKVATALKTKCAAKYGDFTFQQRDRVVDSFKRLIKLTIGIYIEDDGNECNAMIGAALADFCDPKKKKVNIVIDFGQKEPVKVTPDGSKDATAKDTISISGRVFKELPGILNAKDFTGLPAGTPLPSSTSRSFRRLFIDLMGESLRIKHETTLAGVADSSALAFRNDVEVARRKIEIEKDLKAQLQELIEDPSFFTDGKFSVNRRLIRKIQDIEGDENRKKAAQKILNYICNERIPKLEKGIATDWAKFKKKYGLAKGLGVDKIDETLMEVIDLKSQPINFELWTDPVKKFASFSVPDGLVDPDTEHSYVGGGGTYEIGGETETLGDTDIAQIVADTSEVTFLSVTGVDHVYHAALADGGQTLLVSAGVDTTAEGLVIAYSDTDADGIFEAGTRTEAIRDFNIYGGTHFLTDPVSGNLMIFARAQHEFYELGYSGGAAHEFPDMLAYRGSLGFQRFDLELAEISEDGLTATGYGGNRDHPIGAGTLVPFALAETAGGEFTPQGGTDYFPFNDDDREPIAIRRPVEGDLVAKASGRPGNSLMAYEVSGMMISLGGATAGADGSAMIPLSRPLSTTDIIRFYDAVTFEFSADHPVIPLSMQPVITSARFVPYGKFLINFEGVPGFDATIGSSADLSPPFAEMELPPLDDIGTSYYEADIGLPASFFRIGTWQPDN